mmetsp:Transcript_5338/g.9392  ORF Transcript_5338/g.9392 Transcript_5338/m.9392 type:complete len:146 (-) Transcript_5338:1311-1748(-)
MRECRHGQRRLFLFQFMEQQKSSIGVHVAEVLYEIDAHKLMFMGKQYIRSGHTSKDVRVSSYAQRRPFLFRCVHQQQDQYLFCQGFSHQSSESRTILPGGFHAIGFHCGSPVRKERQESRKQQNILKLLSTPALKGKSVSIVPSR